MSKKESASVSPLALGLGIVAVLLVIGVAYVAVFLPSQAPAATPTPQPSQPAINQANDTPAGLPASALLTSQPSCATENTTPVLLFHDPYCPACIANEPIVNRFYERFSKSEDVAYRFVATHSRTLAQRYGINQTFITHDYHVCAQEQNKIQEFKECFYTQLKVQDGDYILQTKAELQSCAQKIGMNVDKLDACLLGARATVDASLKEAADFGGGTFFTPMAVVACQYRVNSALVRDTYCAVSGAC